MSDTTNHDIYASILNKKNKEKRNKRMQITVKPSTFACLEEMQRTGIIKSKNDLINNFLEEFIQRAALEKEKR